MRIEPEPRPRTAAKAVQHAPLVSKQTVALLRNIRSPDTPFLEVLGNRRSRVGGVVGLDDLSSLLWHSMLLRSREPTGRFGMPWESRSAPAAGGLQATTLIILSCDGSDISGIYTPDSHGLAPINNVATIENRSNILEILGVSSGTTIQFATEGTLLDACYEHADTLMWRDAGALLTVIGLVATALGLTSVPVGRTGEAIVHASGLPARYLGTGAVHIGTPIVGDEVK